MAHTFNAHCPRRHTALNRIAGNDTATNWTRVRMLEAFFNAGSMKLVGAFFEQGALGTRLRHVVETYVTLLFIGIVNVLNLLQQCMGEQRLWCLVCQERNKVRELRISIALQG